LGTHGKNREKRGVGNTENVTSNFAMKKGEGAKLGVMSWEKKGVSNCEPEETSQKKGQNWFAQDLAGSTKKRYEATSFDVRRGRSKTDAGRRAKDEPKGGRDKQYNRQWQGREEP